MIWIVNVRLLLPICFFRFILIQSFHLCIAGNYLKFLWAERFVLRSNVHVFRIENPNVIAVFVIFYCTLYKKDSTLMLHLFLWPFFISSHTTLSFKYYHTRSNVCKIFSASWSFIWFVFFNSSKVEERVSPSLLLLYNFKDILFINFNLAVT